MTSPNDFTIEYKLMVREPGEGLRIHEVSEDRKDWDFANWDQKDPEGLAKIKAEDSTLYADLLNAYKEQVKVKNTFK